MTSSRSRRHDLRGLSPNTSYDVRVRAVSAAGKGAWSAVGQATTPGGIQQTQYASIDFLKLCKHCLVYVPPLLCHILHNFSFIHFHHHDSIVLHKFVTTGLFPMFTPVIHYLK